LIAAIRQDPRAQKLLESADDPSRVLQALRSLDRNTGAAVSAYLELVGYRLLDGFDISNPCAFELPDVLCRAIRAAGAGTGAEASEVEGLIADVRGKVPEQHRAQFDELLEEARLTYPIRDERGVFSDIWASGLMRRAALAGGRRLARKGGSTTPRISLTPASTRCAHFSPARAAPPQTSLRSGSRTAPRTTPRTPRRRWARPLRRRRTPPGCRPPPGA